ncbi:MAG: glycogen synthase [Chloroflexi bacterium]|nr:glycogen synthase [Chloroflexota bacterium]
MSDAPLKVLYLAAEAVPFAKVGGLADVAGTLPSAIRALGHDVRLMLPRYGTINSDAFNLQSIGDPFEVPVGPGKEHVHLIGGTAKADLPVYLIWNEQYFSSRDRVYGFEDDAQRFCVFGQGALAALKVLDWKPDVIHVNDWHTAVVPTWLKMDRRRDPFYRDIATLLTIHNLAYQGITGRLILTFAQMESVRHLAVEQPGTVNWLAQGIAHADVINTVSQRYAQEILEPDAGMGLDSLLHERKDRLFGVMNGLDYEQWNPGVDPNITSRFDVASLNRRAANKAALQQQARLPVRPDTPLIGMVSRLDDVKGMSLMQPVVNWLAEHGAQFAIVGTGRPEYHALFEQLQAQYAESVHVFLKFDDVIARRIYAGADIFLMPSYIEPCGLGQMIAMHYGCVPVVRATGGLADTVIDLGKNPDISTGFAFHEYTPEACIRALDRAMQAYRDKPLWRALQQRGMNADFSWSTSAEVYAQLYHRAIALHQAGGT